MTPPQRRVIFEDAKRHSLGFLYYLQTAAHERGGDHPRSFRYMKLVDDYESRRLPLDVFVIDM